MDDLDHDHHHDHDHDHDHDHERDTMTSSLPTIGAAAVPAPIPESIPAICQGVPYMTSLEIAGMLGIRHGNVIRDIERELAKIGEAQLKFEASYRDRSGRANVCYALPGEYLLFIASAYDAKLRMQIIRQWSALNNGTAQPVRDAANLFAGKLVEGTRAERKARIAADVGDFIARHGRTPTSRELHFIEKP